MTKLSASVVEKPQGCFTLFPSKNWDLLLAMWDRNPCHRTALLINTSEIRSNNCLFSRRFLWNLLNSLGEVFNLSACVCSPQGKGTHDLVVFGALFTLSTQPWSRNHNSLSTTAHQEHKNVWLRLSSMCGSVGKYRFGNSFLRQRWIYYFFSLPKQWKQVGPTSPTQCVACQCCVCEQNNVCRWP